MLKQLALTACILACGVNVDASPNDTSKDEYTLVIAQALYSRAIAMVSTPVSGLGNCLREGKNAVKELQVIEYVKIKFYCVKK